MSWLKEERPREKLLSKGAKALSNAELITILLRTGTKNKTAFDLAQELLSKTQNDITQLSELTLPNIIKIVGIGEAKAISIIAALELGRRRKEEKD